MYSSERAKTIVKKDVAHLSAGIVDNVMLTAVRFDKSINGNSFIEFKFEKEGKLLTHTEWEPSKRSDETEESFQNKCDNQFSRIEQILKCYYPNAEDRKFIGENFTQFAQWVTEMLNKADLTTLLRVKIVYNNSGYTTLPKYAKYTFIEPMSLVNENKSVIVKLGIDQFEKPIVADLEKSNPSPFSMGSSMDENNSANPNGLPF